jgi:D-glycerate 3-kinase
MPISSVPKSARQHNSIALNANHWLESHSRLNHEQRAHLSKTVPTLLDRLPAYSTTITGISGPPGCGKSTLARLLAHLLLSSGTPSVVLSLDDYYLDKNRRAEVADEVHPLFRIRGVPGTHDLAHLMNDLERLKCGQVEGLRLPRFDKSTDSPVNRLSWFTVSRAPEHIFVEGWCLGATEQTPETLSQPVNPIEAKEDENLVWRQSVNRFVAQYEQSLGPWLDQRWYLAAPDWESVVEWRWQQEQELTERHLKSRRAVRDFLATYQRLVMHMHVTHPVWADLSLYADAHHRLELK